MGPDAALSLLPTTPAGAHTNGGSVQTEDMDRARGASFNGNGGGRPPFLRIQQNDRLPLSREAIVFLMTTGDKSRRTRTRLEADHSWLLGS